MKYIIFQAVNDHLSIWQKNTVQNVTKRDLSKKPINDTTISDLSPANKRPMDVYLAFLIYNLSLLRIVQQKYFL